MSSGSGSAGARTFGFGAIALKKFPELIPLAAIIGGACVMCGCFMAYAISTKPDVQVFRGSKIPPWEQVKPLERKKLIVINQKYAAIPELEALRAEIGSYKS